MNDKPEFLKKNPYMWILIAWFCALLWGTAAPTVKFAYGEYGIAGDTFSVILFAGSRFALAGIISLAGYMLIKRERPQWTPGLFKSAVSLGLLQTTGQYIFYFLGVSRTSGTVASIIPSLSGFLIVLLSPIFYREDKLTRNKILGVIIGLPGIIILQVRGGGSDIHFRFNAEGFIMIATLFGALGSIYSKALVRKQDPLLLTALQLTIGGAIMMITGVAGGGRFNPNTALGWFLLIYLALVSSGAFALWTWLLKYYDGTRVGMFKALIPLHGTIISGILLGDNIWQWQIGLSLILVILGLYLTSRKNGGAKALPKI